MVLTVVSFVLVAVFVPASFYFFNAIQKSWENKESWTNPYVVTSQEGSQLIQQESKGNALSVFIPSCSLYKITVEGDGSTKLYCSLYPSRYFSALYWLASSASVTPDYTISLPQGQKGLTYKGKEILIEKIPELASSPLQVQIEVSGTDKTKEGNIFAKIGHYLQTRNKTTEIRKGELKELSINEVQNLSKSNYVKLLYSNLKDISVQKLLENFRKDSDDNDQSPHFTEGLVYGLYLLSEEDPILTLNLLAELEKKVIPFHQPVVVEHEISTTTIVEDLISAPHTKFPLCPIKDVKAMNWASPSVKVFLAYQKSQPTIGGGGSLEALTSGIYDENGNLLLYDAMTGVDSLCQKIILGKDEHMIKTLEDWYQAFVDQYFVYTAVPFKRPSVIEGSDTLRGVVLRGLAKDPNISKQRVSLTQIKRSLFDGILWEYLYGK